MAQHKHADVLRAIADCKDVQWQSMLDRHWHDATGALNPITDSHLIWRIKPEPKPDLVYFGVFSGVGNPVLVSAFTKYSDRIDKLKIVFDGETGQLKSAEVLK